MNTPAFQGFTADGFTFLRELRRLQEMGDFDGAREYYAQNKSLYEGEIKIPLGIFVEELSALLQAEGLPLKGSHSSSLFRINRDIRFSSDKSPYKTHAGAVLSPTGSKKEQGVLYIHIDPGGCLMAAGFYRPEPDQLGKLREHVRDNPKKYRKMIEELASHGLSLDTEDTLKRLPRGFEGVTPPDLAAAVKLKGYTVSRDLKIGNVLNAGLVKRLEDFAHDVMPLLEFGWEALRKEQ